MTTYLYNLTFGDDEAIALREAIDCYMAVCRKELSSGPQSPYWSHLKALESMRQRLYADSEMMSTSSPCWPKDTKPE